MSVQNGPTPITFKRIAFRGWLLGLLIIGIILLISGLTMVIYYSTLNLPFQTGEIYHRNDTHDFTISELTSQPVIIKISYSFPLEIKGSEVKVIGRDSIDYNLTIRKQDGDVVHEETGELWVPYIIDEEDIKDNSILITNRHEVKLSPGEYSLQAHCDVILVFEVDQKSRYIFQTLGFITLLAIGAAILVTWPGLALHLYKKAFREKKTPTTEISAEDLYKKDYEARNRQK